MKRIILVLMAMCVSLFAAANPNERKITLAHTNMLNSDLGDTFIVTTREKVNISYVVYPKGTGDVLVYKTVVPTNISIFTNTYLLTNVYRFTNNYEVAISNNITNICTNVYVNNSVTQVVTNASSIRTSRVINYSNIIAFTNVEMATNIRTNTLSSTIWRNETNSFSIWVQTNKLTNTVFQACNLTNEVVSTYTNVYKGTYFLSGKKYTYFNTVVNVLTNNVVKTFTNYYHTNGAGGTNGTNYVYIFSNTVIRTYTNLHRYNFVNYTDATNRPKTNSFYCWTNHAITNTGTLVSSNRFTSSARVANSRITLDKNSVYMIRLTGATNATIQVIFTEIK
jgi:hypothetical protein